MDEKPSEGAEITYQAIFDGMDKLAKHGFEYFLAGISAFILIAGIILTPQYFLSQQELWAISVFGFLGLLGSLYVWRQKATFKFRTNQEKITYKRFKSEMLTRHYEIAERSSIEQQKIAEKAAANRKIIAEETALKRLEISNKFASAAEKALDELEEIK